MKEKEFEKIVREHKNTIYTVCFMFSKDTDEVAQKRPTIHTRLRSVFILIIFYFLI